MRLAKVAVAQVVGRPQRGLPRTNFAGIVPAEAALAGRPSAGARPRSVVPATDQSKPGQATSKENQ